VQIEDAGCLATLHALEDGLALRGRLRKARPCSASSANRAMRPSAHRCRRSTDRCIDSILAYVHSGSSQSRPTNWQPANGDAITEAEMTTERSALGAGSGTVQHIGQRLGLALSH